MSRKGKNPIAIPKGVEVNISSDQVSVKGPKGTLTQALMPWVKLEMGENGLQVSLSSDQSNHKRFHGLYWALLQNMVEGTTQGFEKKLELQGVGFRGAVQGKMLDLQLGFSHPTKLSIPEGLNVAIEKGTRITVSGVDKQMVGQFAAEIRAIRPPEPYKGKGVRYVDEYVRRKAGKAGKAKAG